MSETNTESAESASVQAPSLDAMIDASFSPSGTNARDTTLDEFRITFDAPNNENGQGATSNPSVRFGDAGISIGDAPRKRGRPANPNKQPAKKKAEIARELEQTKAELEALRARGDADKIGQLADQIEMASFLVFGVIADKRGPHWALEQRDAEMLGTTGANALAPYAERFTKEAPWVMFALAIGKVVHTRVQIDKKLVAALEPPKEPQ